MRINKRYLLTILFFGVIFLICVSINSSAQSLKGVVNDGKSLDSLIIGKSTMDDVIAAYGNDYKLIKHKEYSYEMLYKNLGLSFYSCQADPNKEIFVIEMQSPFKAITGKGLKLGESTFADIYKIYDIRQKNRSALAFSGISFYAREENKEEPEDQSGQRLRAVSRSSVSWNGEDTSNNADNDETAESGKKQADEVKEAKYLILKRIELVEKGGLRQCDSVFPKK